jgi:hypothetical protein
MVKRIHEQQILDFDGEPVQIEVKVENCPTNNSTTVDYSFDKRLSEKRQADNREIYLEFQELTKHLY